MCLHMRVRLAIGKGIEGRKKGILTEPRHHRVMEICGEKGERETSLTDGRAPARRGEEKGEENTV